MEEVNKQLHIFVRSLGEESRLGTEASDLLSRQWRLAYENRCERCEDGD